MKQTVFKPGFNDRGFLPVGSHLSIGGSVPVLFKYWLLIFLLLAISKPVSGQNDSDEEDYKKAEESLSAPGQMKYYVKELKNDPDKIGSINFLLGGYTETWQTNNILLGFGLGADIHFNKHVDLYIMGRNATWDDYKMIPVGNNPYWFNYEEMTFGYNFKSRYKDKNYKVSVTTGYITPELTRRTSLALRGGLFHIGTAYDQAKVKAYKLQSTGNPANDTVWQSGINYMDITGLVLGFSVKNMHYGVLDIDGRKVVESGFVEYYFDVLPLLSLQMNENARFVQKFGYRFGLRYSDRKSVV